MQAFLCLYPPQTPAKAAAALVYDALLVTTSSAISPIANHEAQTIDRALKLRTVGLPQVMVYEELGYDPATVERRRQWEAKNMDPYPNEDPIPTVKITLGNGRKGESNSSIPNYG